MDKKWRPHVQLVVDIGSILQQSVHHLGMSVLRGSGESCATILPQKHIPERQWAADEIVPNHKSVTCCKENICKVSAVLQRSLSSIFRETLCFLSLHESQPLLHNKRRNRLCHTSHCIPAAYLCLEFGGGTELKEELDDVIVTLLGGEEEGSRACLEGEIKIDTAVSYSERNNFLCLYDMQKRMGGKRTKALVVAFTLLKMGFSRLKYYTENKSLNNKCFRILVAFCPLVLI